MYLVPATGSPIATEQDALDILGDAFGGASDLVVIPVERLAPDFFRLSTGVAGAVLGKFANYRMRVVIVGDVAAHREASNAFNDFVVESNRSRHLRFVPDHAGLAEFAARTAPTESSAVERPPLLGGQPQAGSA